MMALTATFIEPSLDAVQNFVCVAFSGAAGHLLLPVYIQLHAGIDIQGDDRSHGVGLVILTPTPPPTTTSARQAAASQAMAAFFRGFRAADHGNDVSPAASTGEERLQARRAPARCRRRCSSS